MSSSERVIAYLQGKVNSLEDAALAENFQLLENYYDNKLWNQLSEASKQLVNDPNFVKSVNLDEFYENFIKDFEHRIQKLQLVELIIPIAQNKFLKDKEAAFEFLSKFEKMVEEDKKASVRLLSGEIELHLQDKNPSTSKCKDLAPIRKLIEKTEEKLNQLTEVGPVHASFYKVSAAYQQQVGDYARYYTESLRYLGCEDFSKLSLDQKREHALLLCVAALLGQSVYNFGELLAHPILKTLEGSQKAWLVEVLNALNEGNWDVFQEHKQKLEQEIPDFKAKIPMLEEKLRLLSLMEIAVKLPPKHRNLSFEKIAKATHLDVESLAVELLVMKALANKLLEGSIDQVSRSVNVTWVQPRVLSPAQLLVLADRMNDWRQGVNKVGSCMESQARDIVVTYT